MTGGLIPFLKPLQLWPDAARFPVRSLPGLKIFAFVKASGFSNHEVASDGGGA